MACKSCDNLYYIKVSDEKIFWNALRELVARGCDFEIRADGNNRSEVFFAASFWVNGVGCKSYNIVMKHLNGTCKICGLIHAGESAGESDCPIRPIRPEHTDSDEIQLEDALEHDVLEHSPIHLDRSMKDVAKQACVIIFLVLACFGVAAAAVSFFHNHYNREVMHTTTIRKHTFVNGSDHQYDYEQTCSVCAGPHHLLVEGKCVEEAVAMQTKAATCHLCLLTYEESLGHECENAALARYEGQSSPCIACGSMHDPSYAHVFYDSGAIVAVPPNEPMRCKTCGLIHSLANHKCERTWASCSACGSRHDPSYVHSYHSSGILVAEPKKPFFPACFYCAVTYDPYVGHRCEDSKAVILPMFHSKDAKETQNNLMDRLRATVHNFMKQEMTNKDTSSFYKRDKVAMLPKKFITWKCLKCDLAHEQDGNAVSMECP